MTKPVPQLPPPKSKTADFEKMQRQMFSVLTVGVVLSGLASLLVSPPEFGPLDYVAAAGLPVVMVLAQVAITLGWLEVQLAMRTSFWFLGGYLLLSLYLQFLTYVPKHQMLAESTYWFVFMYAIAFLLYPTTEALKKTLMIFVPSVLICLFHLVTRHMGHPQIWSACIHFLVVSGGIIALLRLFSMERRHLMAERAAAYRDALTGLFNRRAAEERLNELATQENRFTLVLFDLDHFKQVNDRYGHATGDLVLAGVAEAMVRITPRFGMAARWGGEEFLLILPMLTTREVRLLLDTLRTDIAAQQHGELTGVTASFGVATARRGEHPDAVLERADAALYAVKERGRNDIYHADVRRTNFATLMDFFPEGRPLRKK